MEKKLRGFACLSSEARKEIASKGGKAAHKSGRAHEFTSEEAQIAGSLGGKAAHSLGRAHEFTPDEAKSAGQKGGLISAQNRKYRREGRTVI